MVGPVSSCFVVVVSLLLCALVTFGLAWQRRLISLLSILVVYFCVGLVCVSSIHEPKETFSLVFEGHIPETPMIMEGTVVEVPFDTPTKHLYIVDIYGVANGPVPTGDLLPVQGRVRLAIPRTNQSQRGPCGYPGDKIRMYARVYEPTMTAFPGGYSAKAMAFRKGVALFAYASDDRYCVVVNQHHSRWSELVRLSRQAMRLAINQALEPDIAGVVMALALGDRSRVPDKLRRGFRRSGLAHLLAVSGFHFGVLLWIWTVGLHHVLRRSLWVSSTLGAHRLASMAALPVVCVYPVLVGSASSAVRAGVMLAWGLFGRILSRRVSLWTTLSGTFMLMVAIEPQRIYDPGLQMSFAAVAALCRIPRLMQEQLPLIRWPWGLRSLFTALIASFAAVLGTLPISAIHFGEISLVGICANIPAAILASVAVPGALVGSLWAGAGLPGGYQILALVGLPVRGLVSIAMGAAQLPGSGVWVPTMHPAQAVVFYGILLLLTSQRLIPRRGIIVASMLVVLLVTLGYAPCARWWRMATQVTVLPVGQGDGIVIEAPTGEVILIDTGPKGRSSNAGERVMVPYLRYRGLRTITLLIVSHPHADHIGGLFGLIEAGIPIREVWWTGDSREGPAEELAWLAQHVDQVSLVGKSRRFGPLRLDILGPNKSYAAYEDVNDASIVIRLSHGRHRFLFTGDAEGVAEQELVAAWGREGLAADVLKVGHHGSRSSSTEVFLASVAPRYAIISLGRGNRFGFPHDEALSRIRAVCPLWRTDLNGAIMVEMNGTTLTLSSYR